MVEHLIVRCSTQVFTMVATCIQSLGGRYPANGVTFCHTKAKDQINPSFFDGHAELWTEANYYETLIDVTGYGSRPWKNVT
ncbi:MAG: hypothetical protein WD042_18405 [Phycisphaeraceae bacterium]